MRRRRYALSATLVLALSSLLVPTAVAAPSGQPVAPEVATSEAVGTTTVSVTVTGNVPRRNSWNNVLVLVKVPDAASPERRSYQAMIPFTNEPSSTATFVDVLPGSYVLWTGRWRAWGISNIPAGVIDADGTWTYGEESSGSIEVGVEPIAVGPVTLPTGASVTGKVVDARGEGFYAYLEAAPTTGDHLRWNETHPSAAVDGSVALGGLGPAPYTLQVLDGGGYWLLPGPDGPVVSAVPGPPLLDPEYGEVIDLGRIVMPHVFDDVHVRAEHSAAMWWMRTSGYSTGHPDGTYRPFEPVRRDAMAAFLYRAAGSPTFTAPTASPFTDIRPGDAFYKEMSWLASLRITRGWPDGTFRPLEPVKRDAMAAFLYRFVESTGLYDGSPEDPSLFVEPAKAHFGDVPLGTQFHREISWLASAGIARGWGEWQFQPLSPVRRDAMAAFLFRTITDPALNQTRYEPSVVPSS